MDGNSHMCWQGHFHRVLNVASSFEKEVIDSMISSLACQELDNPPTFNEMLIAMRKMNSGTAGGKSGIVPELILYGGAALHRRMYQLFLIIWEHGSVVSDW